MPDIPEGSGALVSWVIGTLITVLLSVVGTVVALARAIEGKYRNEITELKQSVASVEKKSDEQSKKTEECERDRTELKVSVARLETKLAMQDQRIKNLEP